MTNAPRVNWGLAVVATLGLSFLFATQFYTSPLRGRGVSYTGVFLGQLAVWSAWLALAPAVLRLAQRYPYDSRMRGSWLLLQCVLAGVISLAHAFLVTALRWVLGLPLRGQYFEAVGSAFTSNLGRNVLSYTLIAAFAQIVLYQSALRERDVRAARLEGDLLGAKLSNLESSLRPHFLFNTLNTITALVRENAEVAETMLGQLSDLLRASLEANPGREVPLRDELRLAEQYLAIQQVRFDGRLHVSMEATPDAEVALVPQLFLQPLVENAVKHGIGKRAAGGSIWVKAQREDGRLHVVVEDDGVGPEVASGRAIGHGIGLGALRARLGHLYGEEQSVVLSARQPAGATVRVELPYHDQARAQ